MTVIVSKSAVNLREELASLRNQGAIPGAAVLLSMGW
jgi:hypothetical protein